MKKYALILACLAWTLGSNLQAQSAGGGGAGGGGAGAGGASGGSGATGGTGSAGTGAAPSGSATGARQGGVTPGRSTTAPGVQRPLPGAQPGQSGVGTAGNTGGGTGAGNGAVNTAPGAGTGIGADTGATGGINPSTGSIGGVSPGTGVTPGTGAIGGDIPSTGAIGRDIPGTGAIGGIPEAGAIGGGPGTGAIGGAGTDPGVASGGVPLPGTTAGVQPGVNGIRGAATPGVANPVGGVGNANDLNLAQQIRAQLLTGGMGPVTGSGAASSAATSQARALGAIRPESLRNVQISANNGAITLGGTVGSETERRLLENRVRRMTGVNTIQNNLTVSGAGGQLRGQGVGPGTTTGAGTGRGTVIGDGSETLDPNTSRPSTTPIPR